MKEMKETGLQGLNVEAYIADMDQLEALAAIDQGCIGHDGRRETIRSAISEGRCIAGLTDGKAVGFAIYDTHFFENGFISLVMVASEGRRLGVARKMMELIEQVCPTPKLFSSTNESNGIMQGVFKRLGYDRSGRIENLDEGDPEWVYFKQLR